MPEEDQDPTGGTPSEDPTGGTDDSTEGSGGGSALDSKLKDPEVQAEIDRRITLAMKKADRKADEREAAARDKAKKEVEEARLIEDGKLQELADLKAKEADAANAKLEAYERNEKVQALLDKHEILDPSMRELFETQVGELADLDARMAAFADKFKAAVEKHVNQRLATDPPAKPDNSKPGDEGDLQAQIAKATREGNWSELQRLNDQVMADMHAHNQAGAPTVVPADAGVIEGALQ